MWVTDVGNNGVSAMPKTLDELVAEYEAERLAEITRDETPEAIARREAKRKAEVEREIRQGLRTP
jgi:hypothetical protein